MEIGTLVNVVDGSYSFEELPDGNTRSMSGIAMIPHVHEVLEVGLNVPSICRYTSAVEYNDTKIRCLDTGRIIYIQSRFLTVVRELNPCPICGYDHEGQDYMERLVGRTVTVKVTRILPYGVFCELLNGTNEGLLHVSEMTNGGLTIQDPKQYFKHGQRLIAKVILSPSGRYGFSIKATQPIDELVQPQIQSA